MLCTRPLRAKCLVPQKMFRLSFSSQPLCHSWVCSLLLTKHVYLLVAMSPWFIPFYRPLETEHWDRWSYTQSCTCSQEQEAPEAATWNLMQLLSTIKLSLSFTKAQHRNVHMHVHTERERERQGETETETERQIERQTNMISLSFELEYCISNLSNVP